MICKCRPACFAPTIFQQTATRVSALFACQNPGYAEESHSISSTPGKPQLNTCSCPAVGMSQYPTAHHANAHLRGFFGKGDMQKEFEEASFALKPGEISQIVQTASGLHLIERLE